MKMRANSVNQPIDLVKHKRACGVCRHEQCAEIERSFLGWDSPADIAQKFGLADRTTIYRHANAFGLMEKRRRNVAASLEKIVEQAGNVEPTAAAVVAAVQALSKINSSGEWVDRTETLNLHDLFEKMTAQELLDYAEGKGEPAWLRQGARPLPKPTMPATSLDGLFGPEDAS